MRNSYDDPRSIRKIKPDIEITELFVPYWIKNAININKLTYYDILDYDKMRNILSIEDIAEFKFATSLYNNNTTILNKEITNFFNNFIYSDIWYKWSTNVNNKNKLEYINTIRPLSYTDDIINSVINKLYAFDNFDDKQRYHEIIELNNMIVVIIKKGFLNAISNKEYKLNLLREYLSAMNKLLPQHIVTVKSVYKLYIDSL